MSAAMLSNTSVKDALREFEDDLKRARGNLEEALSKATRDPFRQARFDCMIELVEEETEPVKVETDNPFADDDTDTGNAVNKLLRETEEEVDELIDAALEDYGWEIDRAMRRLKARLL